MKKYLSEYFPPHFKDLVSAFRKEEYSHYWLSGGRGSCKSTCASLLIVIDLLMDPNSHAICARKFKTDLHSSCYNQIIKAIHLLEVGEFFQISVANVGAPPITLKSTKQKIYFTGLDDPEGLKSITPQFGYLKFSWFEELHQLSGMDKVRSAIQTIRRGANKRFVTFYTYNPPRSKSNWINEESRTVKETPLTFIRFLLGKNYQLN